MSCLPVSLHFELSLVIPSLVFFSFEIKSRYKFPSRIQEIGFRKVADVFKDGKWHSLKLKSDLYFGGRISFTVDER
jgi:hypothetical protein